MNERDMASMVSEVVANDHHRPDQPSAISVSIEDFADTLTIHSGFGVVDEKSANWVVKRIMESRRYAERVQVWAAAEIRRSHAEERFLFDHFGAQLEQWARAQLLTAGRRRKSLRLPAGTLAFRSEPRRVSVVDEKALLEWCRRNLPEAVKVTVEASGNDGQRLVDWQRRHCPAARVTHQYTKSEINQQVAETGELPAGTTLIEGGEKFWVK